MFLNESFPMENIQLQDINNIPYFVIPMYEVDISIPPQVPGKNYQEEYFNGLDEHHRLSKLVQDLLFEREEFINNIKTLKHCPEKRKKPKREINRSRRKARDITRLFVCEDCHKAYGSEGSLKQHMKLKHSE